jgi:ferritin-like metal-binding protein YciE
MADKAEQTARDTKLIQYLTEAYGKEKELETALAGHIGMTDRAPYKKRLQQHLKETKNHSKLVERRIKKLGGDPATLVQLGSRALAMVKGPVHALRGTSIEEKLLKNAKTEYSEEAEEIATYRAIETLAESVGDRETAKIARQIRREEERMASFLERQIPVLTRAVAQAEIPAAERNGSSGRRRSTAKRKSASRSATARSNGSRPASRKRTTSRSRSTTSSRRSTSGSRSRTTAGSRS